MRAVAVVHPPHILTVDIPMGKPVMGWIWVGGPGPAGLPVLISNVNASLTHQGKAHTPNMGGRWLNKVVTEMDVMDMTNSPHRMWLQVSPNYCL